MTETPATETDKFAALGRFVQAFELMVDSTRVGSISLLPKDDPRIGKSYKLLKVVFENRALTAQPLFDIMHLLIVEIVKDEDYKFEKEDRDRALDLLGYIGKCYNRLYSIRNNIVHATWFIGETPDLNQKDASIIYAKKYEKEKMV